MSPSDDAVYPHAADLALIPCELAPERDRGSFELTPELFAALREEALKFSR